MHWPSLIITALTASFANGQGDFSTPNATGAGGWEDAFKKASSMTANLDFDEKAFIATGVNGPCVGNIPAIPRLGFKGLCLQDGPLSLRQSSYASVFPAGLTAAATWDKDLMYERGVRIGAEFKAKGANIILGPVAGPLGRSARGGRNWEGFSVDPYLTGVAFSQTIKGTQSQNVQACGKHFIGNEQETQRNPTTDSNGQITQDAVSSNIDDRTMHEMYLWPFAEAVRSGLSAIMCSYNRVNQTYSCQNGNLMNSLLKTELGFQGYIMTDWGALHTDAISSTRAGLDMLMPGPLGQNTSVFGYNLTALVQDGSLPEWRLDDMVKRVLTPYFYLNQLDYPTVDLDTAQINGQTWGEDIPKYGYSFNLGNLSDINRDVRGNNSAFIREMGAAGAVLLKNDDNLLPLKDPKRIIVIGNDAVGTTGGPYWPDEINVVMAVGGGSGTGRMTNLVSPLEAIKQRSPNAFIQALTDNNGIYQSTMNTLYPAADVCLIFLKAFSGEGSDRQSLLPDYNADSVVSNITSNSAICPKTVVISHSTVPNVHPWADNVTAIIAAHVPGEQAGNSIIDILYGDINPSGKLPYTIAFDESDYNAPIADFTNDNNGDMNLWQSDFTEGLMLDYRYFDSQNIQPRYEFGYGLSYTNFSISNLQIAAASNISTYPATLNSSLPPPGGNPDLYTALATVNVTVKNTGPVAGRAVPQLYLGFPSNPDSGDTTSIPPKVLRGFERTASLKPGESIVVQFELRRKDVSSWDVVSQNWAVPVGSFNVFVGQSSRDVPLNGTMSFKS
ncbi:putative beta-glucosidase [Talaromyces proteolyticus]|uniref:Probable beta-glucosidase G n=1 Tax=Talaromyces proteolyticus TaxID=1131652 RepID=A0AAD4KRF5_9EURO|nr:putative beta-glucosidase [Talaromyces proteolyticus]KAH8696557.1 putative beta-glucosidase [Talaromyces proteolyticus]